jgi:hypothetical protein
MRLRQLGLQRIIQAKVQLRHIQPRGQHFGQRVTLRAKLQQQHITRVNQQVRVQLRHGLRIGLHRGAQVILRLSLQLLRILRVKTQLRHIRPLILLLGQLVMRRAKVQLQRTLQAKLRHIPLAYQLQQRITRVSLRHSLRLPLGLLLGLHIGIQVYLHRILLLQRGLRHIIPISLRLQRGLQVG